LEDELEGLKTSRMPSDLSVMAKQDNVLLKIRGWRIIDVTAIIKKAIAL